VLGTVSRRVAETVVVVFALLGFCFVPLGSKTALAHTIALTRTLPARDAGAGLVSALERARGLLFRALAPDAPAETALPLPSGGTPVSPVPPPLARPGPERQR
jgi:hypothetical protein